MKNFLLDKTPNFGETKVTLKDDHGRDHHYTLERVRNNGCIFSETTDGITTDDVVLTMSACRALFLLLNVPE
jgi:hypothetical protein